MLQGAPNQFFCKGVIVALLVLLFEKKVQVPIQVARLIERPLVKVLHRGDAVVSTLTHGYKLKFPGITLIGHTVPRTLSFELFQSIGDIIELVDQLLAEQAHLKPKFTPPIDRA